MPPTLEVNLQTLFVQQLVYQTYRKSVAINLANRAWESEVSGGWEIKIPYIDDRNVTVETLANRAATESEIAYNTTQITLDDITPFILRGAGQLNLFDIDEVPASDLEMRWVNILSTKLAIQLDDELFSRLLANANFDSITGNGTHKNLMPKLGSDTDSISRAFPWKAATDVALDLVAEGIRNGIAALVDRNAIEAETLGPGAPSAMAVVMRFTLANILVDYLEQNGDLDMPGSAGRQAAETSGIMTSMAWMGRYRGADIVATNATAFNPGAGDWPFVVMPTNSAFVAGVGTPMTDTARYGEGNTDGLPVVRRTVHQKAFGHTVRPEHIIRGSIDGGS